MCRRRSSVPWQRWRGRSASGRWPAVRSCALAIMPMRWYTSMRAEIVLPEFGAVPVVISVWFADPGEAVYEGDRLVEVAVSGATFDVSSPATGRLVEKLALPDDPVLPGQVLGVVEVDEPTKE